MGALAYFPTQVAKEMPITGDMSVDAKTFNTLRKTNPALEKLRSTGKKATLTLASLYGDIHRKSHKCWKLSIRDNQQERTLNLSNSYSRVVENCELVRVDTNSCVICIYFLQ